MADEHLKYLTGRLTLDFSDLDKAQKKVQQTGDEVAKVADKTKPAQSSLSGLAESAGKVGDRISVGVSLPLAAAGVASVKLASDFEGTFAQMQALAGVTAGEVDGLKRSVLDLSGHTAQAPQDLAKALYFIRSAGLDGQSAMDALTVSAKASAIGMGQAESVADALTSVMNAYGPANISAAKAGDILTAAVRAGKVEASQMAPQFGRLLPVAANLKIGFGDVAGAFAFLSRNSGDASLAATQVGGVMNSLIAPVGSAAKALDSVGLSGEEVRKVIQEKGLIAALRLLNDRFGGSSEKLRAVFGDIQGFQGALTLLQAPAAELDGVMNDVNNSAGALDQGFQTVSQTAGFKTKQAFADLQAAAIGVGDTLLPIVSQVAGGVSTLAATFGELPGPVQNSVLAAGAFLVALGPILSVGGRVAKTIDQVKDAFGKFQAAMSSGNLASASAFGIGGLAAAGVLTSFVLAASDSAKKAAEARARVQELDAAFKGFSGSVGQANQKLSDFSKNQFLTTDSGQKAISIANKMGLSLDDLNGYVDGNAAAVAKVTAAWNNNSIAGFQLSSIVQQQVAARKDEAAALIEQAQSMQIVNAAQADQLRSSTAYGAVIAELKPKVDKVKDASSAAAKGQDELSASTGKAADALGAAADAADPVTEKVDTLADSLEAGAKAAGSFKKGLDLVAGGSLDAIKAADGYQESIANLTQSVKDNGRNLDEHTEKGRKNRDAIVASTEAAFNNADAMLHNGQTTQEAADFINNDYVPALRDQLGHLGLNTAQQDAYIAMLKLTPHDVDTAITISNQENARAAVQGHLDHLNGIPAEKKTAIQALIDQGKLAAAELAIDKATRPRDVDVILRADIAGFLSRFPSVFRAAFNFDTGGLVPVPKGMPVPAIVHGGEYVLSADVVDAIKAGRPNAGLGRTIGSSPDVVGGAAVDNSIHLHGDIYGDAAFEAKVNSMFRAVQQRAMVGSRS